jgi:hypothetical protein
MTTFARVQHAMLTHELNFIILFSCKFTLLYLGKTTFVELEIGGTGNELCGLCADSLFCYLNR